MIRTSFNNSITLERVADEGETVFSEREVQDARKIFRVRRETSLRLTGAIDNTGTAQFDWLDIASPFAQAEF